MKRKVLLFICLFPWFFFSNTLAEEKEKFLSVDIGSSTDDVDILRIGIRKDFERWPKKKGINIPGYVEAALILWNDEHKHDHYGIALSPVFTFHFCDSCQYQPYFEIGIGITFVSDTKINDLNISSSFQFEDRLGFGIEVDDIDYHLRYMHYSNASIKKPNPGIDMIVAGMSFKF